MGLEFVGSRYIIYTDKSNTYLQQFFPLCWTTRNFEATLEIDPAPSWLKKPSIQNRLRRFFTFCLKDMVALNIILGPKHTT